MSDPSIDSFITSVEGRMAHYPFPTNKPITYKDQTKPPTDHLSDALQEATAGTKGAAMLRRGSRAAAAAGTPRRSSRQTSGGDTRRSQSHEDEEEQEQEEEEEYEEEDDEGGAPRAAADALAMLGAAAVTAAGPGGPGRGGTRSQGPSGGDSASDVGPSVPPVLPLAHGLSLGHLGTPALELPGGLQLTPISVLPGGQLLLPGGGDLLASLLGLAAPQQMLSMAPPMLGAHQASGGGNAGPGFQVMWPDALGAGPSLALQSLGAAGLGAAVGSAPAPIPFRPRSLIALFRL